MIKTKNVLEIWKTTGPLNDELWELARNRDCGHYTYIDYEINYGNDDTVEAKYPFLDALMTENNLEELTILVDW